MHRTFRPAGDVTSAVFMQNAPLFTSSIKPQYTKVQKDGLRYEKRVQSHVQKLLTGRDGLSALFNPWVLYHNRSDGPTAANFCQPDIVLAGQGRVWIIECKLTHTNDSWQQLRLLYEPVLRKIYPKGTQFALVEVCKWFDPHTRYNETYYYCEDIFNAEIGRLGIHIYKPRGRSS